ncbi:MAG: FkbM family methyltransferase [Beijerinckiaceae bacterium]|nr:FkbM family methyltransferase [Beijerinckiaceae bacterium]
MQQKLIYDFGANNGDDLPYYLMKADKVVAVEANPELAAMINARFADEIGCGRLFVENCVLTVGPQGGTVPFYIHRDNHVLSQMPRPSDPENFDKVDLPARNVVDLIARHGAPHYIKIDIEHYDSEILTALFKADIRPPFISAEAHSRDVMELLIREGGYPAFNVVDGSTVARRYRRHPIEVGGGPVDYSFPHHSAGPFGADVAGPWMTPQHLRQFMTMMGFGWKDIHATTQIPPDARSRIGYRQYASRLVRNQLVAIAAKNRLVDTTLRSIRGGLRKLR